MVHSQRDATATAELRIGSITRFALAAFGLCSIGVAVLATFVTENAAAATAFLVAGVFGVVLALVGLWPARLVVGGSGVEWALRERVAEELRDAAEDAPKDAKELLLSTAADLSSPTGKSGAREFDDALESSLQSVAPPQAVVTRAKYRSDSRADFWVTHGTRTVWVESKFIAGGSDRFRGTRLPPLLDAAHAAGVALLVVVNAGEVAEAQDLATARLGDSARVVTWYSSDDDDALASALQGLLET
jgi:hypothetical protein